MKATNLAMRITAPVVLLVLLALGWQYVATHEVTVLPRLQDMWDSLTSQRSFWLTNMWHSLWCALVGFVIGTAVALLLAVLVITFDFLRAAVMPLVTLLHVTPIVAIAPALVVAFGFSNVPHITVAAIMAVFPMLINALAGFQAVDRQAAEVFEAMSAGRAETFLRLRLPSSVPFLFTGARVGVTGAMVGEVISEFFGSTVGLGAVITTASSNLDLPTMWCAIVISALVSLVLLTVTGVIEKLVVRW